MPLFDRMHTGGDQIPGGRNPQLLRSAQQSGNPWEFRDANPNLGNNNFGPGNAYAQSIPQQAEDYDSIMQGFRDQMQNNGGGMDDVIGQYNRAISGMGNFQENQYEEDPRFAESYGILRGLTETGGLSDKDMQDLRARSASPIRAVYANAKRGLERQKALSGSTSANYAAATAKMARQQGAETAGALTNANAAIAEMRQKGILQSSSDLGRMGTSGNELRSQTGIANQRARGEYGNNLQGLLAGLTRATGERNSMPLQALQGMTSLYSANPGLVETFGRQTQNQQQINNQSSQAHAQNRTRRALGAAG